MATVIDEIGRFLGSVRDEEASFDRVLASVLFTDIVGSTEKAAELGDRRWRETVEGHHATVRAILGRYHGVEIDTAGDGFFATFDGPARAVRCAQAIVEAVRPLELEVRAGVHTGEVETIDGKTGGIAVNIGARVGGMARPSEVLVSSTVKDLVAGSGLVFEDRGERDLKGIPDRWHLYRCRAVTGQARGQGCADHRAPAAGWDGRRASSSRPRARGSRPSTSTRAARRDGGGRPRHRR